MKGVGVADLKARLSEHLRSVRKGRSLTVLDRETPVARLVPYDEPDAVQIRRATRQVKDLPRARPTRRPLDSLAILLAERNAR